MRVELGCATPVGRHDDPQGRPVIVYVNVPDTEPFDPTITTTDLQRHVERAAARNNGITNFPGAEAIMPLIHPGGLWPANSYGDPTWAWSDNGDMQRMLSEYWGCPADHPAFVEETHWRRIGGKLLAPGVPNSIPDVSALVTNVGVSMIANAIGGSVNAGTNGTASGTSATSLTTGAITSVTANQYAGAVLITPTAWANVISHTSGTTPVFTLDQWYSFATPGGSAASTPSTSTTWNIVAFAIAPAYFMGITTTNITPGATDTSLSGEATTNGMGRAISTFAISSAVSGGSIGFTSTHTYTYSTTGALTFFALGLFNSIVKADVTDTMFWESSFSGSFTVSNSGDQATVTDTITVS